MKDVILQGNCLERLKELEDNSVDLVCTDPPYGIGFMGKEWDTFKPDHVSREMAKDKRPKTGIRSQRVAQVAGTYDHSSVGASKFREWFTTISFEMLRVLKPGAFAFVCIGARQDSVSAVITAMTEAGFKTDFSSIYWTYASGFPKAMNIGKMVDKRFGSEEAKALDGSYGGFQPKPAVEVIIVAMKPLSEKTYVDQALKNGKGITWLDDCRIPSGGHMIKGGNNFPKGEGGGATWTEINEHRDGRFPANLLVSDDVLNDGRVTRSVGGSGPASKNWKGDGHTISGSTQATGGFGDSGSYSRYFDLDAWAKTLPFLIVPKASKSEKNRGLEGLPTKRKKVSVIQTKGVANDGEWEDGKQLSSAQANHHPTVKPLKLMSYLITLGSREGDTVLDPFAGSCTTLVAAQELKRNYIGIEREDEYVKICEARLKIKQPILI